MRFPVGESLRLAGAGLASLALVVAGCGGGAGSTHLANLGTTTPASQGVEYAACMRKHGVPNFPDPTSAGVIHLVGPGLDPSSTTFESAQSACQKLSPKGGPPTPAQQAQRLRQLLAFSRCMRAHGIEDFPDPTSGRFQLNGGPIGDLNPDNLQFQRAQAVCGHGEVSFRNGTVRLN